MVAYKPRFSKNLTMTNIIPRLEFIVQSILREQQCCPYCNSKSNTVIASKNFFTKIKKCENCQIYFTSPIYKPWFLSNLYDSLYSAEGSTTTVPTDSELKKLKNNNFDGSDKCFVERIQSIKNSFRTGKLLEFGSSWGYFLYQAQKLGFEGTGIELSEPRRTYGTRNLQVNILKSLDEVENGIFDFIYTAHTLEHLTDPSGIFQKFACLLKENGILIIEVPNFYPNKPKLSLIGAVHPLGFSCKFFEKNLSNNQFKIIGFYDSWEHFPNNKVTTSNSDIVIAVAQKTNSPTNS